MKKLKIKKESTVQISVRLPESYHEKGIKLAEKKKWTLTTVVYEALREYLDSHN